MRYYGIVVFEETMAAQGGNKVFIKIETSLPTTLNQSYTIVHVRGTTRLALSQQAREYKEEVALLAANAWTHSHGPMQITDQVGGFPVINGPGGGEYRLELVQWLPKNTRDVDANVKLVMDGICRGIGLNDNRVFEVALEKRLDRRVGEGG